MTSSGISWNSRGQSISEFLNKSLIESNVHSLLRHLSYVGVIALRRILEIDNYKKYFIINFLYLCNFLHKIQPPNNEIPIPFFFQLSRHTAHGGPTVRSSSSRQLMPTTSRTTEPLCLFTSRPVKSCTLVAAVK